jgi:HEAT repeat protein/SMI1/KNR4 family protein SUKH-1
VSGFAGTPDEALADLEARLRKAEAPVLHGLNKGIGHDAARGAFAKTGKSPDPALLALYTWRNGARGAGPEAELLRDARFMPLEEALKSRDFELRLAAENQDLPEFPAATFFDPEWFPILSTAAGNLYVVERMGAGRVLLVDREDSADREEIAPSLLEFIDGLWRGGADLAPAPVAGPIEKLVQDLVSSRPADRTRAAKELSRKRPAAAFAPLVSLLESDDGEARRQAALVLGLLNDRRAIPILIRCLARWSGKDVNSAWGGLIAIGDDGALGHLDQALKTGDRELRLDAIKGLVISRDPNAVAVLEPATRDPDPAVREAAAAAMRRLAAT